ncbi:DUF1616 domain-containing protein [Natrialba sp. INN-245]|uniref:DUF1616 domain-containing protein n=1 Tax=Natrialba sp. INN-245 TaxID=2690967 RepID=UPI0013122CEC|nr:DUF1616 domain-containing protein [Natrialba sp. INN-245]MWV39558.1 DUF1616 domain-containing protein [Natrialba sp. INN-245]
MSFRKYTRTRLASVLSYPADLATVSALAVLSYFVITSVSDGGAATLFFAIPLALFLPGYALVSVLFPTAKQSPRETPAVATNRRGIDATERIGLAFALSLAIVPLVVLTLPVTEWGLETEPLAASLAVFTVGFAQLGAIRRLRRPEPERFTVSPIASVIAVRRTDDAVLTASSILLTVAVATAIGALIVGFLIPASAGGFTELGLYTADEDGELVAGDLPDEIEPGEQVPVTVSIENQEGERTAYTVVVQQQVLEDGAVVDRTELQEVDANVSDGATVTSQRQIGPTAEPGETVRISVLLYEGDPPVIPTNENADEDTYFWVTVTDDPQIDE